MKLLLDTCTALWIAIDAVELSTRARELFVDDSNQVFFSAVSAWEITLKHALGKLPLPSPPDVFVPRLRELGRMAALPLEEIAVLQLARLPNHHRDPFDRALICQAIAGGLTIVTPDEDIRRYPVLTAW